MSDTRIEIIVSGDAAAETLEQITSQLPEDAVVASAEETATLPSFSELLKTGLEDRADLAGKIATWREAVELNPYIVLAICAAIFLAAYAAERVLLSTIKKPAPRDTAGDVLRALYHFGRRLAGLFAFFLISQLGIQLALPMGGETEELALVTLNTVMFIRVWYTIIECLTAPGAPERRPTGLSDGDAQLIMRHTIQLFAVMLIMTFAREFIISVVDAGTSGALFALATRIIASIATAIYFVLIRRPIGDLIVLAFAANRDDPGAIVSLMRRFWPVVYILLLALQLFAESYGYLTGSIGEGSTALKRSFAAFILAPFLVAGLRIWRDHLMANAEGNKPGRILGIFSLLEGALIVGTAIFIMYAWNLDPFATDLTGAARILPGLISAAIVTVIGVSAWRTASAVLVNGAPAAAEEEGDDAIPDGEGGAGGSRIETVLPVLRAVIAAFIATVTVLLALSSLGVQIAPLLAGAGILGIAIGFGAQKVVEDVISGVLYLVEDAFRKGEYIETSQGKGVVEAIMLRSVRLRHHLGPVFTIPFSAMGTIQNHSRDWVTVKLKFEVGPEQDLEKVRKLVKKVGQQLLEDPEIEGQFLAPLKSQGAVALVGSNYQIGVKFTSEPGKQFLIRRKALNAIQKAFKENGIEMAAPRVIVDSGEPADVAAAVKTMEQQANPTGAA